MTTVSVLTIDLNELEEGETTFTWDSSAEDLDLSDAEVEFSGPIRTVATLHRLADTLSAQGQTPYKIGGKEVRDYVLLEIPMNPVCKEYESGTCPKLVDVEKAESEASDRGKADPRWDALKALKNT